MHKTLMIKASSPWSLKKRLLTMLKLSVVLLSLSFSTVFAEGSFAQTITLRASNISLSKAMRNIKKQTGISYFLKGKDLADIRKDVDIRKQTLSGAMNKLVSGLPVDWMMTENGTIVIKFIPQKTLITEDKENLPITGIPDRVITGTVRDENGEPLPGVTVVIKDTNNGTTTDSDGGYSLTVSEGDQVLVFSFVGFGSIDKNIEGDVMDVVMQSEAGNLDEVVVVAFGTQKKVSVTGSVSAIRTEEIQQSPAANLTQALAGRLPGLTDIQRSGQPGLDNTQLFIRGVSTSNTQNPLILVDGVERDITFLNPNEVQDVTILKDVSSTALFGVRGANGVILVTTKRGETEVPQINFKVETGGQAFTRLAQPVNSYNYAVLRNQTLANDGVGPEYSEEAIEHLRLQDEPNIYPNTDYKKLLLKSFAPQTRYDLNIAGKGKRFGYFVDAGFLNQGSQFKIEKGLDYDPDFHLKRYNFRSNVDVNLTNALKAFLNVAGYLEQRSMPNAIGTRNSIDGSEQSTVPWILASMLQPRVTAAPVVPAGWGDTSNQVLGAPGELEPAYGKLNRGGYVDQTASNVTATYGMNLALDFITKGLSAKAIMSFDSRTVNNQMGSRDYEVYTQIVYKDMNNQDSIGYERVGNRDNTPLSITGQKDFNTFTNFQANIEYSRDFEKHSFNGLLLFQKQKRVINDELPYNLVGTAMRLNYGYDDRYFLEFNAGLNGSEQFAPSHRFGFFPAISGAWVASNENFLKHSNVLTYLKLRGSYGKVGNDRLGNRRFLYLDDVQLGGGGVSASLNNGQRVNVALLKNESLQWEVAKKKNLGIEIGMFNDITINLDLFHERRNNILISRNTIPDLFGLTSSALPPVNLGIVRNKGFELELGYKKAWSGRFSMLSKGFVSYARNKVLFADEPLLPEDYTYRLRNTGFRLGQNWGYLVEGYFRSEDQIDKAPIQNTGGNNTHPGDFKYSDLNGDMVVDERDLAPIGYSNIPEITVGASFLFNYNSFDLSFLLQGVTHTSNYYSDYGVFPMGNFFTQQLDAWTPEHSANGEKISYPRLTTLESPNEIRNSFFILDNSYLRLKNVEIGYTFPPKLISKLWAKKARIYVNGFNLITLDKLPTKNFDPELTSAGAYPLVRIINTGIDITF